MGALSQNSPNPENSPNQVYASNNYIYNSFNLYSISNRAIPVALDNHWHKLCILFIVTCLLTRKILDNIMVILA